MKGNFIVLETETFYKLIDEVVSRIKIAKPASPDKGSDWISAMEAKKLLGIKSQGKLKKLQNEKRIVVSKHGRTILYSKKSIFDFLEYSKIG